MKTTILIILAIAFAFVSQAQIVNIPDANFKNALINHTPVIDLNTDGEIQVSEAEAFSGHINVSVQNISDMTGIEAFIAITGLYCDVNQIPSLNLDNNTALEVLGCHDNQLTSLYVDNNTALTELNGSIP